VTRRSFRIGMPQMAAGCLSENWLLRELGALHWDTLCASLGRPSEQLIDNQGRRLYATFVRVRVSFAGTLADFQEGEDLHLDIEMARFGQSTLLSTIHIDGNSSSANAEMMSTFSFRSTESNTALAKSEPPGDYDASITSLAEVPRFFAEYSEVRKARSRLSVDGGPGQLYPINPFTDSNGANLLYFASYQSIHDFLVFRDKPDLRTKSRDIFYFRNCDLTDSMRVVGQDKTPREDLLVRASDGECVAFISTEKESSQWRRSQGHWSSRCASGTDS
jgi:probable biosynthetic protein (TIGR04098 family)